MDNEHKYLWHQELCSKMNTIYRTKNETYHNSFGNTFVKYGPISALTRIGDKFNRIENLILGAKNQVPDETIKDTLLDMANYCLMTLIEMEEKERLNGQRAQTAENLAKAASNTTTISRNATVTAVANRDTLAVQNGDIIDHRDQVSSFRPNPYTDKCNFGPRGV